MRGVTVKNQQNTEIGASINKSVDLPINVNFYWTLQRPGSSKRKLTGVQVVVLSADHTWRFSWPLSQIGEV